MTRDYYDNSDLMDLQKTKKNKEQTRPIEWEPINPIPCSLVVTHSQPVSQSELNRFAIDLLPDVVHDTNPAPLFGGEGVKGSTEGLSLGESWREEESVYWMLSLGSWGIFQSNSTRVS